MANINEENETITQTVDALNAADFCGSCELVGLFTDIAHGFLTNLSTILQAGIVNIFIAVTPVWFLLSLLLIGLGKQRVEDLARNLVIVIIALILLQNNGNHIVTGIFGLGLELIGSTAQLTFLEGNIARWAHSDRFISAGIVNLVYTVEKASAKVFDLGSTLMSSQGFLNSLRFIPFVIVCIYVPYFLVVAAFFAQIVMSIFRLIILSIFAPIVMFFAAFDFGRGMGTTTLKTILSSLFIAVACTAAMSLMVFALDQLIGTLTVDKNINFSTVWPVLFMLATIAWMGIGFMLESTNLANSLAGSVLGNAGAAVITGGISAVAATASKVGLLGPGTGAARLAAQGLGVSVSKGLGAGSDHPVMKGVAGASNIAAKGYRMMEIMRGKAGNPLSSG